MVDSLTLYYTLTFLTLCLGNNGRRCKCVCLLFGIHLYIGSLVDPEEIESFFTFYAFWDLVSLLFCLFIRDTKKKVGLVALVTGSYFLNVFNIMGLSSGTPSILYIYYTQINTALIECIVAILASYIQGRLR